MFARHSTPLLISDGKPNYSSPIMKKEAHAMRILYLAMDTAAPYREPPNYSMHSNLGLCTSRRSRVSSERDGHTITYVMVCPRLCVRWWYMIAVAQHIGAIRSNRVELRRGDLMAKRRSAPQKKPSISARLHVE